MEAIVRALNTSDVQYLIVDGLAVNAHGDFVSRVMWISWCNSIKLMSRKG